MSVLIKGMEMPQDCGYCIFERHTSDGYECLINGTLTEYQKRPDDCPLVPVPPHGRLVDADELYPIYADLLDGGDVKAVVPKSVIDTSPTIIPASEEGEL